MTELEVKVSKYPKVCTYCDELTINVVGLPDLPPIYCAKDEHEIKDMEKETCENWNMDFSLEFGIGLMAKKRRELEWRKGKK